MASTRTTTSAKRTLAAMIALTLLLGGALLGLHRWNDATLTPRLGLDLEGGTEMVLAPRVEDGAEPSAQQIEQARDIIVQRVDSQGVSGAEVTTRGGSSIVVTMPGTPSQRTVDAIRASSQMQFRPVFFIGPGSPEPAPAGTSPTEGSGSAKKGSTSSTTTKRPSSTSAPGGAAGNHAPLPAETSPSTTKASSTKDSSTGSGTAPVPASEAKPKKDDPLDPSWVTPAVVEQFVALDCAKETSRKAVRGGSDKAIVACSRDGEMKYILGPVAISGDQIKDASAGFRTNQQGQTTNEPEIALSFNDDATAAYRDLSRRMVQLPQPGASQAPAPLNALATVLDGEVLIAPGFNEPIPNGQASVTGGFTIQEARDLARSLKFGALPISFDLDGRSTISPTLGSEQLRYGLWAGLIGLVLVVLYSLAQYRVLGLVTVGSMLLAALLTYLAIALLGWTSNYRLDMAGITGLILAIGVTADSFIVYFERIRDELRDGRSLRSAVDTAWSRARRTIFAADGVNFLAAAVLYLLASSGVRGFAFTLGLTTLIDLLVVVMFTHPLVTLLAQRKFFADGHPASGLDPSTLGPGTTRYVGRGQFRPAPGTGDGATAAPAAGTEGAAL